MIKFRDIGTFKVASNVGYCKVPTGVTLKNGMGVTIDMATKTVALPTTATAKGDVFIVINTIEKPEIKKPNDYTIEAGEYPRCFRVKSLDGRLIDVDMDTVTGNYTSIATKDKLVFGTDGKLIKIVDVTGYATYFEVIEKTNFGGAGLSIVPVVAG